MMDAMLVDSRPGTGSGVKGQRLYTYKADAITREHAISLASHQAYLDGLGDAELHQTWSMTDGGTADWYVQFKEGRK